MYRFHPDSPACEGRVPGVSDAQARSTYARMHEACVARLESLLDTTAGMLREPVACCEGAGRPGNPKLYSHAGLRRAVSLLNFLAYLLPPDMVLTRVQPLLLPNEAGPFCFPRCDARARIILLRGCIDLLRTLHWRQLSLDGVVATLADLLANLVEDLSMALPLLEGMLDSESLPLGDVRIGPWVPNLQASQVEQFAQLSTLFATTQQVAQYGLSNVAGLAASHMGLAAGRLLSPRLLQALLSSTARLHRDTRREGLALVCEALDATQVAVSSGALMQLGAAERSVAQAALEALCQAVKSAALPCLEAMVEALARCLAFLLDQRRLSWDAVERLATSPHHPDAFWRVANRTYRQLACFLLAQTLQHAPLSLTSPGSIAGMLRIWLQAQFEGAGRLGPWYTTAVLAGAAGTRPFFLDVREEDVAALQSSVDPEARAALVAGVVRRVALEARAQLGPALCDLDAMLAARCREVGATAFDPGVAAQRYAGLAWPLLHGILAELAVAEGYSRLDPALSHLRHAGSVRLASWVAEAALSLARDGSGRGGSSGAAANTSLEAVGVLRRRAQATVLRHLPSLWSLMLTWRPQATPLLEDHGVQQPLWTVAAAFLELGSGAEQASPSDAVLAETLARSLAEPGPGLDSIALGELRGAVVAGFCARALARVSIRHVSNERVAVVALRLVQVIWALLTQPSMRSAAATLSVLQPLLRVLLEVLCPASDVQSVGTQSAALELLAGVLPRCARAPPSDDARALAVFWRAAAEGALLAVAACLPPFRPAGFAWSRADRAVGLVQAMVLAVARAHGEESGAGIEHQRVGRGAVSMQHGVAIDEEPSLGAGINPAGDQPLWPVPEHSPGFLAFPAMHYLIAGGGVAAKPLAPAYRALRASMAGCASGALLLASLPLKRVGGTGEGATGDGEERGPGGAGGARPVLARKQGLRSEGEAGGVGGRLCGTPTPKTLENGTAVLLFLLTEDDGQTCRCLVKNEPLLGQLRRSLRLEGPAPASMDIKISLCPMKCIKVENGVSSLRDLPDTEYGGRVEIAPCDAAARVRTDEAAPSISVACSQAGPARGTPRARESEHEVYSQVTPAFSWAPRGGAAPTGSSQASMQPASSLGGRKGSVVERLSSVLARLAEEGVPKQERNAALKRASLSCLAQALHWLVHSAPLSATARCAEYRHDGALASLRSLSISVAASAEAEGRDEEELLLGTEASTLMDAAGTLHLSSGSAQESSAASRAPCQHMLPSPSTPPAGAFGDHQALGSAATEHAEVAPPPPFLLPGVVASRQRHLGPPSHAPSSSLGPLEGDMFHGGEYGSWLRLCACQRHSQDGARLRRCILDSSLKLIPDPSPTPSWHADGGPAPAALPPFLPSQRPAVGSRRSRDPGAIYRGSEALPDFGMDLEGERSAEHSEEEEEDSDVSGSASSDGGESDADIDLGRLQAAPAEAPSPQAATMPRDTQALERRGAEGAGASEPPAAAQQSRFRQGRKAKGIEDGQLDDDDVAARRYARLVPQMIRSIPDEEDCKRARQAYRHWFNMASDPWDRWVW
ncbi:hypothetical protein F751_6452 [Auxenochlorella protothecoides]|uniref:Uncharacterized protein n=1 Tax=Auxenochlorella protothecoides TaxID=3075 RepID=A0A087SB39_AUXPR|nr:hypothetical protein F751_6452 [Auxenochlorella protothecoides]KFM22943.1 hypothetical protein F751_6452 [Auxenochlorella protothecoides]